MCLFKEFKRNFTNLMNHEKKKTEGNDRVKMAAVSEKKFLKGGKWGKACRSLYLVEQFVTRCDEEIFIWKNLRWKA